MAPIEELEASSPPDGLKARKLSSTRARPSTPTPPSTQLKKEQGRENADKKVEEKAVKDAKDAKLQRMPRSKLYHISVACCFIGTLVMAVLYQNKIREVCRPAYDYLENTLGVRIFYFVLVCAIPEPSPVVISFAAWVAFGNFGDCYQWFFRRWGEWAMFHVLLPIIVVCIYYTNGFLCLALELELAPEWMNKYRIQQGKKFDIAKLPSLLRRVTFNFLFVVPPVTATLHRLMKLRYDDELPGPLETILHIFSYIAANEIYFYYVHSLMHRNKTLYGWIHKVHHEYKQPVALASLYAHPLEVTIVILGQFTIGPILFGGHMFTILVWTCSVVMVSQTHHCGFHWPWIPTPKGTGQPEFHDLHHEKFNMNYGSFEGRFSLDGLHGTLQEDPWAS
eukprot:TRINITY_DN705_c0_g1_i1.p1 TRINITY_DN705_c0_g1~~TRINITY_DN705_c0_g1_i1.p1  ORF type:complete len:393 (+),score=77.04 TRINITY_DN705_c0_g1_i1:59-1237(+)